MTDPFSEARSGFVKFEDIVGRGLLFVPLSSEIRKSTLKGQEGKDVLTVITDIVVLDGPVTEQVEAVPLTLESVPVMSTAVVNQLKVKIGKKGPDNKTPAMVLGVLGRQTSSYGTPMWILEAPEEKHKALARQAAKAFTPSDEDDPFA